MCSLVVTEAMHSLSLRVGTVGGKSTLRMCFYLRCLEGSSRTWVCVCVCGVALGGEYSGLRVGCQSLMTWVIGVVGQYGGFLCGVCDLHHKTKLARVEILALPLTYKLLELTEPSPYHCLLSALQLNETVFDFAPLAVID